MTFYFDIALLCENIWCFTEPCYKETQLYNNKTDNFLLKSVNYDEYNCVFIKTYNNHDYKNSTAKVKQHT